VLIFGRNRDEDCHNIREFLSANRIPYEGIDRDVYRDRVPGGLSDDPDCPGVSVDGQLFNEPPTTREIAEALQLQTRPNHDSYDVVVVAAGPAGMAAAVYGTSEGLTALIVERYACGGQAGTSSRIENYLGFPEGISGDDLTGRGFKQANRFGAAEAKVLVRGEGLKLSMSQHLITRLHRRPISRCFLIPRLFLLKAKIIWNELKCVSTHRLRWRIFASMKPMHCL
jgi:hypothetical protein